MSKRKPKEYSGTNTRKGRVKFHFYRGGATPFLWNEKLRVGEGESIRLLDIARAPVVSGAEYEIQIRVRVRELPTSKPKKERNPWDPKQKL